MRDGQKRRGRPVVRAAYVSATNDRQLRADHVTLMCDS
jgi:hypothetical protein